LPQPPQHIERPAVSWERGKAYQGVARRESIAGGPEASHGPRKAGKLTAE
jgi:hypothetical protein